MNPSRVPTAQRSNPKPSHRISPLADPEPPWVQDTVDDAGVLLRLSDIASDQVTVEVYSHQGVVGESVKLRWAGIASSSRSAPSAVPTYETAWEPVVRNNGTLYMLVPKAEANFRAGHVAVSYEVFKLDGSTASSPRFELDVVGALGLAPIEVEGAHDGTIRLADVPVDGATMSVPRQAALPAGSTIRFFWEGADATNQPVRGFADAFDNGHTPTTAKLPRPDLQRVVGKIALRYTVDTATARARVVRPLDHYESDWVAFTVMPAATLPAPRVEETGGADTLVPYAARDGATVAIDADLVATDSVTVTFGSYTSQAQPGARPLRIVVPPSAIAKHLDSQIDVFYTVTRGSTSQSQALVLHVGALSDGDAQLPTPRIDRADSLTRVLDLSTFMDDPIALVDPWLLMGAGQTVWLRVDGTAADGRPATAILYSGAPVRPEQLATGLEAAIDRAVLEDWKSGSELTVTCKVNFSGGAEASAVSFNSIVYVLQTGGGAVSGRMYELEPFEDPSSVLANGITYRLRFATIRPLGGRLQSSSTTRPPYLVGRHAYLQEQLASVTARINFDHPAQQVQMGIRPSNNGFPAQVIAYDGEGGEIGRSSPSAEGWVRFAADGTRGVAALEIISQPGYGVDFDNLLVTTGSPWDVVRTPHTESFDDLPLGSHGHHFEFDRWFINADGGLVAIENAPGGMNRQVLAIHMDPAGSVHQLTPQYAICPRIRTSLYMRSSAVTSHRATVNVVYINREDLTFRTVAKAITLSQSAQRVVFDAVNDVARDTEYVSHIRVVNQNGTLISTVFYDDITFE
jgi:hypothetical protein